MERAKVPRVGTGVDGRAGLCSADPRAVSGEPGRVCTGKGGFEPVGQVLGEELRQLTVIHQGEGNLVLGFSILELGCVRPLVILGQLLDDHLHQALLSDKIDLAVLREQNRVFFGHFLFWELCGGHVVHLRM